MFRTGSRSGRSEAAGDAESWGMRVEKVLYQMVEKAPETEAVPETAGTANSDTVLVVDAGGTVLSVASDFEAAAGYSRYEVIGKNIADLADGGRDAQMYRAIWRLIRGNGSGQRPFLLVEDGADGRAVDVVPLVDTLGERSHYVAIRRDARSRGSTMRSPGRPESPKPANRLAAGIARQVNQQLFPILGYTQFLLSRPDDECRGRAEIEAIREAGERIAAITRQLLAYSRMQARKPKTLDVNAVVSGFLERFSAKTGAEIEVVADLEPYAGRIRIDPSQFEQILTILAERARRNMPGGGCLTVATSDLAVHEPFVRQGVLVRRGKYVMLSVHDTGPELSEDAGAGIFEPFSRTLQNGHSLGLAAVYGSVTQNGGYLWVFSRPGSGTAFRIYLPRANDG